MKHEDIIEKTVEFVKENSTEQKQHTTGGIFTESGTWQNT